MTGGVRATSGSEPMFGSWVPTAVLHLLFLAVAAGLCLLVLPAPFWLAIGLALALAGTVAPNTLPTWWLLLLLGVSQYWRDQSAIDIVYYLLLAGLHFLHVLGNFARLVPWSGRLQLAAIVRPLTRFVLVQTVVQPLAFVALIVFGDTRGAIPWLPIVAATAIAFLAAVLYRGRRAATTVS